MRCHSGDFLKAQSSKNTFPKHRLEEDKGKIAETMRALCRPDSQLEEGQGNFNSKSMDFRHPVVLSHISF